MKSRTIKVKYNMININIEIIELEKNNGETIASARDDRTKELMLRYGKYGLKALKLSMKKTEVKKQQYSVSFVAAVS